MVLSEADLLDCAALRALACIEGAAEEEGSSLEGLASLLRTVRTALNRFFFRLGWGWLDDEADAPRPAELPWCPLGAGPHFVSEKEAW